MEPSDDGQRPTPAVETAAEWFARIRGEQVSAAERREYVNWLRQSPRHVAEILRLGKLYGQLRVSKLHSLISHEDVLSGIVDRYPPPGTPVLHALRVPRSRLARRPRWRVAALVIAIVLIAALGLAFQHSVL